MVVRAADESGTVQYQCIPGDQGWLLACQSCSSSRMPVDFVRACQRVVISACMRMSQVCSTTPFSSAAVMCCNSAPAVPRAVVKMGPRALSASRCAQRLVVSAELFCLWDRRAAVRVRARFASAGANAISWTSATPLGCGVDGALAGYSPDNRRTAARRRDRGPAVRPIRGRWKWLVADSGGVAALTGRPPAPVSWADFCAGSDSDADVSVGTRVCRWPSILGGGLRYAATTAWRWYGLARRGSGGPLVVLTHGGVGLAGGTSATWPPPPCL